MQTHRSEVMRTETINQKVTMSNKVIADLETADLEKNINFCSRLFKGNKENSKECTYHYWHEMALDDMGSQ